MLPAWLHDVGYYTANVVEFPAPITFKGTGKTDWNFTPPPQAFDSSKWADLKEHQPFYAQVNFQETHRAFHAPVHADPSKIELPPYYPDHPIVRADYANYLDAATEVDRKIGVILQQLRKDGLDENTIILVFGDNGEAHARGKQFCYEEGLVVPLIVHWPKGFPQPAHFQAGAVDDGLHEAIDLAPTTLQFAGAEVPVKMQGSALFGPHGGIARKYAFGARDRCDETVIRLRTVRDARFRYIRNFTPEQPFLAKNEYKEKQYPVWTLLPKLLAEGKLTPPQAALCAPHMAPEELYDLETDPHEIHNLAAEPAHLATRERLRQVLERWMDETNDQGRVPEPEVVVKALGTTQPGTNPQKGYTQDGGTAAGVVRPAQPDAEPK